MLALSGDAVLLLALSGDAVLPLALTGDEHRPRDDPVGQVIAAGHVGVRQQEHVLWVDASLVTLQERPNCKAAPAGVNGDAVGVGDQRSVRSRHVTGEIVALAEDRAARGTRHDPAHVLADLVEPVLHDCEHDRVQPEFIRRSRRLAVRPAAGSTRLDASGHSCIARS